MTTIVVNWRPPRRRTRGPGRRPSLAGVPSRPRVFLKELTGNSYHSASRTRRFIDAVEVRLRAKLPYWIACRTTASAERNRIVERPPLVEVDLRRPRVRGSA
jgi:hypothetical protein